MLKGSPLFLVFSGTNPNLFIQVILRKEQQVNEPRVFQAVQKVLAI
jgi:hypothetical protein